MCHIAGIAYTICKLVIKWVWFQNRAKLILLQWVKHNFRSNKTIFICLLYALLNHKFSDYPNHIWCWRVTNFILRNPHKLLYNFEQWCTRRLKSVSQREWKLPFLRWFFPEFRFFRIRLRWLSLCNESFCLYFQQLVLIWV